jgi:hypothetical protein
MGSARYLAFKNYGFASMIVVVGIGAVAGGTSEGVYIVAAGVILGILARAVQTSNRSS